MLEYLTCHRPIYTALSRIQLDRVFTYHWYLLLLFSPLRSLVLTGIQKEVFDSELVAIEDAVEEDANIILERGIPVGPDQIMLYYQVLLVCNTCNSLTRLLVRPVS